MHVSTTSTLLCRNDAVDTIHMSARVPFQFGKVSMWTYSKLRGGCPLYAQIAAMKFRIGSRGDGDAVNVWSSASYEIYFINLYPIQYSTVYSTVRFNRWTINVESKIICAVRVHVCNAFIISPYVNRLYTYWYLATYSYKILQVSILES